ncbi:MAG: translation initiation factor IF-2, partial [Bacteroidota bacterium]
MTTATKTPRLLAAAKEFNIGKETLVEFLTGKGFEINASNPNTKLTEVMYDALQAEFAQDRLAKRKSEELSLPKGSLLDNLKKSKESAQAPVPEKVAEPEVKEAAPEKKKEEKPKAKEPEVATPAPTPVVEVKVEVPAPTPVAVEPEEAPKKAASKKKSEEVEEIEVTAKKKEIKVKEEEDPEHIE